MRVPLVAALAVNQTWRMGFVSDAICRPGAISRRIKCLTVADDHTHECVDITADFGIGGHYVTRLLDKQHCFGATPRLSQPTLAGVYLRGLHDMSTKARPLAYPS